jgi:hypothetical protein
MHATYASCHQKHIQYMVSFIIFSLLPLGLAIGAAVLFTYYALQKLHQLHTTIFQKLAITLHHYIHPPLHWQDTQQKMPNHCPTAMAQIAVMTAALPKLDISLATLLDTGCFQHTFHNEGAFAEIQWFHSHEMMQGITGIGKMIFQPIGIGTVNLEVSVNSQRKTLTLTNVLWCLSL